MEENNRPVMILFMGGTEEHAVTSFQKYYPESVHIVTSDKYAEKYETLLDQWSGEYGFRRGVVSFVDDLFEPSGMHSLVGAFYGALHDERENGPERPHAPQLAIGITGGTMHMAVTGAYLAQVVGGFVFYVLRPKEGQAVVPNRDVIHFPIADCTKIALQTNVKDINYLMSKQKGTMEELSESGINEYWFDTLRGNGMLGINEDGWYVTVHGADAFNYVAGTRIWSNFHSMLEFFNDKDKEGRGGSGGGSDDIGWQ
jgi:hypothetical protein